MAETKPTKVGRWATDGGATIEPAAGEKDVGWEVAKKPPARFANWLHNIAYQWFNWLNERMFDGATAADLEVTGVDVATGTDQDGGDLELSGGSSTGDGGSEITFKLPKAGQGAGAAVRTPAEVAKFKETGAFNQAPVSSDPASGAAGDRAIRVPGKVIVHDGDVWGKMVTQVAATTAVSSEIANTAVETDFDVEYVIPAGTLRIGDVIRVRALISILQIDGVPTMTIRPYLGAQDFGSMLFTTAASTDFMVLEWDFIVLALGATGDITGWGTMAVMDDAGTVGFVHGKTIKAVAIDTTGALAVKFSAKWSAAHANNRIRLEHLIVQIQ